MTEYPWYEEMLHSAWKQAGLSQKRLKQLWKDTGTLQRLTAMPRKGRVSCRELLEICAPAMRELAQEPEQDWLAECYAELAHGLFPDPHRPSCSKSRRQAIWFYVTLLSHLLEQERQFCPYDPLSDVSPLTPEELDASLIAEEYRQFSKATADAHFLALLRIGREIMPFDPASHTIGVHHMALHMARQAAQVGLPVDVALVSASALSHDIGKFGCRGEDAARIPYLHYYFTWQWLNDRQLPKIAHIAANHSTWDLEFENLPMESLLLIYADFRVRGTRENGRETVRIYTLEESYDMIFSKLSDVTPEKTRRYSMVYRKLSDFERFLRSYGVRTEPMARLEHAPRRTNAALLTNQETVAALCNLTFRNNTTLMYTIMKDVTFGQLLEQARSEKNLHRIRTYLRLFDEYNTYMTGANKRRTLQLLYELLMHHQGDVRRTSARIMGAILANSGPRYRKELPSGVSPTASAPATAAFLTESVELWKQYIQNCLHPDHKISAKHAQRISNSLKIIAQSLFASCDAAETVHYLEPLLDALLTETGEQQFILIDALFYVPLHLLPKERQDTLILYFTSILRESSQEPLLIVVMRRLEMLQPPVDDALRAQLQRLAAEGGCAVSYLAQRLCAQWSIPCSRTELPVSELYLSNLKNAVHWMVKLTQVDALRDHALCHPEAAFHTAMHLSNLLSVSEHLPVREWAGAALLSVADCLTVAQRNEIAVDLTRELETGQDEISAYIPPYLAGLLTKLPLGELEECLSSLEDFVRSSNVRSATAALLTLGQLLASVDSEPLTRRLLGLLLAGVAHYDDTIHQSALTVLCETVLANQRIPMEKRRACFLLLGKKLLTLLEEPRPGRLNFFTQAAVMNHLYRFLTDATLDFGPFAFPQERPVAFFPGTFDPFTTGHKQIVEAIQALGFDVYLAIDEFSWSKQPLPKLLRRQIAAMSTADRLNVYLFPDEIPVNIAYPEDLDRLYSLFPGRKVFLVAGSDVIVNATAYEKNPPGGAGSRNHIIFLRDGNDPALEEQIRQRIHGELKLLALPAFYETVSSTRIREYVDKNMDISMLVNPMVQNFIYDKGMYLHAPQFKQELTPENTLLSFQRGIPTLPEPMEAPGENCCTAVMVHRLTGKLLGWAVGHTVRSAELLPTLGSIEAAEYLRHNTSGRILMVDCVRAEGGQEAARVLLNELLVRSLLDDHTYALCRLRPGLEAVRTLLPQLGFRGVQGREDVFYVDMRTPVVLIQDVLLRFKEPHRSNESVRRAVFLSRPKLRLALARLFPGSLIAAFDAELLNQALTRTVQVRNGVAHLSKDSKERGPCMCVPYGKILAGEVVPHTVTKSLHVDKAYQEDIYHFIIREYPGYSNLQIQAKTIKSFHRPVILVDDLLHKGYRIEKLSSVFRQEALEIKEIIVGILSGRGKDLMDMQGMPVESEYFIPNLRYWFTESLLYPFIGGDSIQGIPAEEGFLPTANLILPYVYPGYLRDVEEEALLALSQTALENARDILTVVERQHQLQFSTALTIRRLAEAFMSPRVPYRGHHVRYDLNMPASAYVKDDLLAFRRIHR